MNGLSRYKSMAQLRGLRHGIEHTRYIRGRLCAVRPAVVSLHKIYDLFIDFRLKHCDTNNK